MEEEDRTPHKDFTVPVTGEQQTEKIIQKKPWEMTEGEFHDSAEKGRIHSNDSEAVMEVANGTKPVAVVVYWGDPSVVELLNQQEILDKVNYRLFTHPNSNATVAIVAPKSANLNELTQIYIDFYYEEKDGVLRRKPDLKETVQSAVKEGEFYGYSQDDINSYLNYNFGYDRVKEEGSREE